MSDPNCENCGANSYLGHLNDEPLCQKCWNIKTRDLGQRNHEEQEWHDKLDRVIKGEESYPLTSSKQDT